MHLIYEIFQISRLQVIATAAETLVKFNIFSYIFSSIHISIIAFLNFTVLNFTQLNWYGIGTFQFVSGFNSRQWQDFARNQDSSRVHFVSCQMKYGIFPDVKGSECTADITSFQCQGHERNSTYMLPCTFMVCKIGFLYLYLS